MDCDWDPPEFSTLAKPKARKDHRCCECDGVIKAGERYEYLAGKWDGYFEEFKTCMDCVALWCDVNRTSGNECGRLMGGLSEEIENSIDDTDQRDRLRAAFLAVRSYRRAVVA